MNIFFILVLLLPVIAFLYASVGHGGASSYIIILTLLSFSPNEIKPAALILNIVISFIAFLSYYKACVFPWKIIVVMLLTSVPASYLGGTIILDEYWYRKILGFLLFFPVFRFSGLLPVLSFGEVKPSLFKFLLIGLSIGFVSGVIGIGGGIILSPLLLIFRWTDIKQTAAVSALFIFFNSVAGLIGGGLDIDHLNPDLLKLLPLTIAGGIAGAYIGASKLKAKALTYILTAVLLIASIKLMAG